MSISPNTKELWYLPVAPCLFFICDIFTGPDYTYMPMSSRFRPAAVFVLLQPEDRVAVDLLRRLQGLEELSLSVSGDRLAYDSGDLDAGLPCRRRLSVNGAFMNGPLIYDSG